MSTDLATIPTPYPALDFPITPAPLGPEDVLRAFLEGRKASTLRSYSYDLADFSKFLGAIDARAGMALLLALPHGHANKVVFQYRAALVTRGMKAATISRRLSALRSVVEMGQTLGVIQWNLNVSSPKVVPYRDTRGPGLDGWKLMLAEATRAASMGSPVAIRDLAIVRLLHDLALRRNEVVALDLGDVSVPGSALMVLGKGHTDKIRMTLPKPTRDVLAAWLAVHPARECAGDAPLFVRLDPGAGSTPERLTGQSIWGIVRDLGAKVGLDRPTKPHGLRHQAITSALDAAKGNVAKVKKFSRHVNVNTVLIYDDNRNDDAGEIASMVAG